jgi:hypothetical protein
MNRIFSNASEHKYDLEKLGSAADQLRRDCAFFYDTFLAPMKFPAPAHKA